MLQESHGMQILKKHNIAVPKFGVARTPEQAAKFTQEIGNVDAKTFRKYNETL